jgi:hypothetical protein
MQMRFLGSIPNALRRFAPFAPKETEYYQWMRWRWDHAETLLEGRFRTPYCAPKGKLERHPDGTFTMYIYDPPKELLRTECKYHRCFIPTSRTKGEYRVHYDGDNSSFTIDGHIQNVERALVESFQPRR